MAPKISNTFVCIFLLFLFHSNQSHATSRSASFEFLNKLQGCQKGDNIGGIHKLKMYLHRFGYISYDQNSEMDNIDVFDDLLESALKTYQLNYNLNVTGVLDASTVSTMIMPRCGVADIINGTTRMRSGTMKTDQHHGSNFLRIVPHYALFPGNPKWTKFELTYAFRPDTRKDAWYPVSQAFLKWAAVSSFVFIPTTDYQNADLKISFERLDHGDGTPFEGPGGQLAHSFMPMDGRLHYDADEEWADGPVPGAFDLGSVALHEIGHLIGLAHSSVENAIMFPGIGPDLVKNLDKDDIDGLKDLYSS